MCELLRHITCLLICSFYVFIKIDDLEAHRSMKIKKTVVLLVKKFWKLLANYFPWYAYGYSTSFNTSICGFGHLSCNRYANSNLFSWLELMYNVECQNFQCSTPARCGNLNGYLAIKIHNVLYKPMHTHKETQTGIHTKMLLNNYAFTWLPLPPRYLYIKYSKVP